MAGRQPVALGPRCVVPAELAGRQVLTELELGRQPVAFGPPARHHSAAGRRLGPVDMVQRSIGVGGEGPCTGPCLAEGSRSKFFL